MTDGDRSAAIPDATSRTTDPGSPPRMPGWVKWPAVIIGVVVLVFGVLQLVGMGGVHGPGRHIPGGDVSPSVAPGQHTPMGGHR
jgi:hypothetical protein